MERLELARLLGAVSSHATAPHAVVVDEADPMRFIAAFAGAVAAGGTVFVADPAWSQGERTQFNSLVSLPSFAGGDPDSGWLCLPTGGSSGAIKLVRHDAATITAAVNGFCAHFGVKRINAVGLLPLNHVSGFMAWMRTVLTGGEYRPWSWKILATGDRPVLPADAGDWFLSLVPTQLQRLLADPVAVEWLRGFRAVFIGGGPSWRELIAAGAEARLPLAFTYGMTETAAMVTALRPETFLANGRGSGAPLPHVRIAFDAENRVVIEGQSLFRGYWPAWRDAGPWTTGDVGAFDAQGSLHLLGRMDSVIITGGKKADPMEIEMALRATGEFADVAVIGAPDQDWGEVVLAFYLATGRDPDFSRVERQMKARLAAHKHPKRYVPVDVWPRNAQGKINRRALTE